jgi:hypothetical protein
MRAFARYIGIDYSGAQTPTASLYRVLPKTQRFPRPGSTPDSLAHSRELTNVRIFQSKLVRKISSLKFCTVFPQSGALENKVRRETNLPSRAV